MRASTHELIRLRRRPKVDGQDPVNDFELQRKVASVVAHVAGTDESAHHLLLLPTGNLERIGVLLRLQLPEVLAKVQAHFAQLGRQQRIEYARIARAPALGKDVLRNKAEILDERDGEVPLACSDRDMLEVQGLVKSRHTCAPPSCAGNSEKRNCILRESSLSPARSRTCSRNQFALERWS